MKILSQLLSSGVSDIIDSVGGILDKLTLTKQEKQEIKLEMQSRLMKMESELETTYRTELDSRAEIIKAEMAQGDKFTKRARPTIVYAGLIFIFIVHVILPIIAYITGNDLSDVLDIKLPPEFWWAWGTVVSVYGAGRSAEKMGITNQITQLATGSGTNKVNKNKNIVG